MIRRTYKVNFIKSNLTHMLITKQSIKRKFLKCIFADKILFKSSFNKQIHCLTGNLSVHFDLPSFCKFLKIVLNHGS